MPQAHQQVEIVANKEILACFRQEMGVYGQIEAQGQNVCSPSA